MYLSDKRQALLLSNKYIITLLTECQVLVKSFLLLLFDKLNASLKCGCSI